MNEPKEITPFETALTWLDILFTTAQIAIGLFGFFYFALKLTRASWGSQLFICTFFAIWIVQAIRVAKTFHLYADRLVVRRPFFFSTKTDQTFKVDEIREAIFRRIKVRFGGPHLIIKAKRLDDAFRIDFGAEKRNEFITELNKLGIKVSTENI